MATLLYSGSGSVSPLAGGPGGASWAPYSFNAVVPGFGAAIPAAQLPAYAPGCTIERYVQNSGATGPITNGNLVVDIVYNVPAAVGSQGVAGTAVSEAGQPICIVYTVAGGILT